MWLRKIFNNENFPIYGITTIDTRVFGLVRVYSTVYFNLTNTTGSWEIISPTHLLAESLPGCSEVLTVGGHRRGVEELHVGGEGGQRAEDTLHLRPVSLNVCWEVLWRRRDKRKREKRERKETKRRGGGEERGVILVSIVVLRAFCSSYSDRTSLHCFYDDITLTLSVAKYYMMHKIVWYSGRCWHCKSCRVFMKLWITLLVKGTVQ